MQSTRNTTRRGALTGPRAPRALIAPEAVQYAMEADVRRGSSIRLNAAQREKCPCSAAGSTALGRRLASH